MGNRHFIEKINKGTKFNNWTVVEEVDSLQGRKFLCINSDGVKKEIRLCHLKNGASKGLSKKERYIAMKKHGMHGTRFYTIWQGMKRRCYKEYEPAYKNYGGRGIIVCNDWLEFIGFYNDMFSSYSNNMTIERIDNNGNYCKENCKWIPMTEQSKNRRTNCYICYKGKTQTIADWSRELNINYMTLRNRLIRYKMPVKKAFSKNIDYRFKN